MAHHAKIENGIVTQVIVTCDSDEDTFAARMLAETGEQWVRTSFNNRIRKQYCGIGYSYNAEADVFVAPQPFPSWSLDDNHDWQPPVAKPTDDKFYTWSEDKLNWIEVAND